MLFQNRVNKKELKKKIQETHADCGIALDGDADRIPFGQIIYCVPLADTITKLKAFCRMCGDGKEALFTYCKNKKKEQVCVGGAEMYMPLCRMHYMQMSCEDADSPSTYQ